MARESEARPGGSRTVRARRLLWWPGSLARERVGKTPRPGGRAGGSHEASHVAVRRAVAPDVRSVADREHGACRTCAGRTVLPVRPSSRLAFAISWVVFAVTVVLAWRKVLALPDGDITRLFIPTVAGGVGLALLGAWLQDHERQQ